MSKGFSIEIDMSEIDRFNRALSNTERTENMIMDFTHLIAKRLHSYLLMKTPVKTGQLRAGWSHGNNLACKVVPVMGGYEVKFTNNVLYARWVNDGHLVRNRSDSPYYTVKHRTVEYYDGTMSPYYVYGHFFVEKSIFEMTDGNNDIDHIVYKILKQWWEWCLT